MTGAGTSFSAFAELWMDRVLQEASTLSTDSAASAKFEQRPQERLDTVRRAALAAEGQTRKPMARPFSLPACLRTGPLASVEVGKAGCRLAGVSCRLTAGMLAAHSPEVRESASNSLFHPHSRC